MIFILRKRRRPKLEEIIKEDLRINKNSKTLIFNYIEWRSVICIINFT